MTTKELHNLSLLSEIERTQEELHKVQTRINAQMKEGINPATGVLTPNAELRVELIQKREMALIKKLENLLYKKSLSDPSLVPQQGDREAEQEIGEIIYQVLTEKEENEQDALREIREAREKSTERNNEINR